MARLTEAPRYAHLSRREPTAPGSHGPDLIASSIAFFPRSTFRLIISRTKGHASRYPASSLAKFAPTAMIQGNCR